MKWVLLVTWLVPQQQPNSYQVQFARRGCVMKQRTKCALTRRASRRGPERTRQFSFPLFRQPVRRKENEEMAVTQQGTRRLCSAANHGAIRPYKI